MRMRIEFGFIFYLFDKCICWVVYIDAKMEFQKRMNDNKNKINSHKSASSWYILTNMWRITEEKMAENHCHWPNYNIVWNTYRVRNLSQYAGNSGWKTPHPNKNQFLLTLSAMLALTCMFAQAHSHFPYVEIESVGFSQFSCRRCNCPVTESTTRFYPDLHSRLLVNWPSKTAVWNQYK